MFFYFFEKIRKKYRGESFLRFSRVTIRTDIRSVLFCIQSNI